MPFHEEKKLKGTYKYINSERVEFTLRHFITEVKTAVSLFNSGRGSTLSSANHSRPDKLDIWSQWKSANFLQRQQKFNNKLIMQFKLHLTCSVLSIFVLFMLALASLLLCILCYCMKWWQWIYLITYLYPHIYPHICTVKWLQYNFCAYLLHCSSKCHTVSKTCLILQDNEQHINLFDPTLKMPSTDTRSKLTKISLGMQVFK